MLNVFLWCHDLEKGHCLMYVHAKARRYALRHPVQTPKRDLGNQLLPYTQSATVNLILARTVLSIRDDHTYHTLHTHPSYQTRSSVFRAMVFSSGPLCGPGHQQDLPRQCYLEQHDR